MTRVLGTIPESQANMYPCLDELPSSMRRDGYAAICDVLADVYQSNQNSSEAQQSYTPAHFLVQLQHRQRAVYKVNTRIDSTILEYQPAKSQIRSVGRKIGAKIMDFLANNCSAMALGDIGDRDLKGSPINSYDINRFINLSETVEFDRQFAKLVERYDTK